MDIQAIQVGLATAAGTVANVRAYPTLPDAVTPVSTGVVFAATELEVSYDQTFGKLTETLFTCAIFASRADEVGRATLASFIAPAGATSLKAALETDRTLGGACRALIVERCRGAYRIYTVGDIDYLGALLDVRVWA